MKDEKKKKVETKKKGETEKKVELVDNLIDC